MSDSPLSLNSNEAAEVAHAVATTCGGHVALADGLREIANQASTQRVASALRRLADATESGGRIEDVCQSGEVGLPVHLRSLISAAARTGQLGNSLDRMIRHEQEMRSIYHSVWSALLYPIVILSTSVGLYWFFMVWLVPPFKAMFLDFELQLPSITLAVIGLSDIAVSLSSTIPGTLLGVCLGLAIMALVAASKGWGGRVVVTIGEQIPIMGLMWKWSTAAAVCHHLSLLLESGVGLAESLEAVGPSIRRVDWIDWGKDLAKEIRAGRSLFHAIDDAACLPLSATPFVKWGESTNRLPQAFAHLHAMYVDRVRARAIWLRTVFPAGTFLVIGCLIGMAVVGLFLPLMSLIQGLS